MIDPSLIDPKLVPTTSPAVKKSLDELGSKHLSPNGFLENGHSGSIAVTHRQNGNSKEKTGRRGSNSLRKSDESMIFLSTASNVTNGQDEEAVLYPNTRMLQDPNGRLCKSH